jgi:hypothetical protein
MRSAYVERVRARRPALRGGLVDPQARGEGPSGTGDDLQQQRKYFVESISHHASCRQRLHTRSGPRVKPHLDVLLPCASAHGQSQVLSSGQPMFVRIVSVLHLKANMARIKLFACRRAL